MRFIAALVCAVLVVYLYWRDRRSAASDRISWAPFCWMFIAGTRFVSAWLSLGAPASVDAYAEGSPVDRAVFFALIVWGALVLSRRDIKWPQLLGSNKWLIAYFLYCLLSMAWTDEPTVLAKRWLKDLGNPIMALVLLTEQRPFEAVVTTVRRLAFFVLPVSVLFIRYFPELGRGYTSSGGMMYSGVADNKNTLGLTCLIASICYVWTRLLRRDLADTYDLVMAAMLAWLLYEIDSKTSLTCVLVVVAILFVATRSTVRHKPTRIMGVVVCGVLAYVAADSIFEVKQYVLAALGRDATLTNRTELWAVVRELQTNAIVGTGFMSFWAGSRMTAVWNSLGPGVNQAHNGYLEQYLNLGYVGVVFIVGIALVALFAVRRQLQTDYAVGTLRLCILAIAMLYNYTEASFYGINNMWVLFLAASIELSPVGPAVAAASRPALTFAGRRRVPPLMNPAAIAVETTVAVRGAQPHFRASSWQTRHK